MPTDKREPERTRSRYQRIAPLYDTMELHAEPRYSDWRSHLWSLAQGPKILEVGVGAGKNMSYYPPGMDITAIDLTPGMLERAKSRAKELSVDVDLHLGDVQDLDFPNEYFDDVIATFVFCSVPDPIKGVNEIARVLKPNGRALFLEHVRSTNPIIGSFMDLFDPITVRLMGPHINRKTAENVRQSHLRLEQSEDVGLGGIFKLIVAGKSEPQYNE